MSARRREGRGAAVRKRRVIEIRVLGFMAGVLLLAGAMAGYGVGEGNVDGRGGERDGAANKGSMTADKERTATGATAEPAGLDVEVVSPIGFGEGSLWATKPFTCHDTGSASASAPSSEGASFPSTIIMEFFPQAMCAMPGKMVLKRLAPRSGEEVASITLEGFTPRLRRGGRRGVGVGLLGRWLRRRRAQSRHRDKPGCRPTPLARSVVGH